MFIRRWFKDATNDSRIIEANAMCLATCDDKGDPSNRYVLNKGYDEKGFTFFTNYESKKAQDISKTHNAALCFYWEPL